MSFRRFEKFTGITRSLEDYFDATVRLLTDRGILFSINDSNEQDFTRLYQKAYYLYGKDIYKRIGDLAVVPETLLVRSEKEKYEPENCSVLMTGAGFGILRESGFPGDIRSDSGTCRKEGDIPLKEEIPVKGAVQAVLKFGIHGGYHGHFDRLSLASFIKDGKTFHNNEYAWYGYDSFLFKMWVQTSMAHNMTVVDGRMQKPSICRCIYFKTNEEVVFCEESVGDTANAETGGQDDFGQSGRTYGGGKEHEADSDVFSTICAQTVTEWMDPPYGGQTPYPFVFPEEKCAREGRFILTPPEVRRQGETGICSEPLFQRRLLILFHGYCIIWDYLEGQEEHRYDCLYHPMGRFDREAFQEQNQSNAASGDGGSIRFVEKRRFSDDPFGAGQFIFNCYTAQVEGTAVLHFWDALPRVNGNDIMDNMPESSIWRAWPQKGEVTIGRYPQRGDTFTEENRKAAEGYLDEPLKKTVSFSAQGTKAEFITLLEAGNRTGWVEAISSRDFRSIVVKEKDGRQWRICASGMADREGELAVAINGIK